MKRSGNRGASFSYDLYANSSYHGIAETPVRSEPLETIPLSAFAQHASTLQAAARYLVDVRGLSFGEAALLLGRSHACVYTSYHQTTPLTATADAIQIPTSIFTQGLPPLMALVTYLRRRGLRNVEIARMLHLDPRTTWTTAKRAEVRA